MIVSDRKFRGMGRLSGFGRFSYGAADMGPVSPTELLAWKAATGKMSASDAEAYNAIMAARLAQANAGGTSSPDPLAAKDQSFVDRALKLGANAIGFNTRMDSPNVSGATGGAPGLFMQPMPADSGFPTPLLIGGGLLAAAVLYKFAMRKKTA